MIIIGCTMDSTGVERKATLSLRQNCPKALMAQYALPWLLPYLSNNASFLQTIAERCDGLMLTSGGDPSPSCWDEEPRYPISDVIPERDETEISLIRVFVGERKPILALCRGSSYVKYSAGRRYLPGYPNTI